MPTTVNQNDQKKSVGQPGTVAAGAKRSASVRSSGGKHDLLVTVKYTNNLPDVPFDPKYISYPFDPNRFVQYNPTSLERNYKHDLLTEVDLGVPIDLILPETYSVDPSTQTLHEADQKLLEEEVAAAPTSKRAQQHAKSVSWLRRTEYISTEYNRSHAIAEGAETKVGYSVKKKLQDTDIYKDRASQIAAIEQTFEAAKQPITKHYSKPGVVPKEILPVFPDFELWKYPFAQVIFDTDPAGGGSESLQQQQEMSQAMIRGMMDENNEQFVAYFLPTEETLTKRHQDDLAGVAYSEDEVYEYKMAREYNWNVKNKASKGYEETYFLVLQPNHGVFYNEIETRVRLSKRRARANSLQTCLLVKHRELTEGEAYAQESRLTQLEPPVIEEGEEMGDEEREIFGGEDDEDQSDSQTAQSDAENNSSEDNE